MPIFELTGNVAFDYFFNLNMTIGLITWGFVVILRLLRS